MKKKCESCNKTFEAKKKWGYTAKTCSASCASVLANKNREFTVDKRPKRLYLIRYVDGKRTKHKFATQRDRRVFIEKEKKEKAKRKKRAEDGELTLKDMRSMSNEKGVIDFDRALSDLKSAFMRDFTDEEACHYAKINRDTLKRWRRTSTAFTKEVGRAKDFIFRKAKQVIADSIADTKNREDSKWLLERRKKELYASRTETTGRDGDALEVDITNYKSEDFEKMTKSKLRKILRDQLREEMEK